MNPSPGSFQLYSDGVTEPVNPDGDLMGKEGLQNLALTLSTLAPEKICDRVFEELERFRGGKPSRHDVTVLAVRFGGELAPEQKLIQKH